MKENQMQKENNMKYYVVTASPAFVDDFDSQVAVFKDEEKCKSYVEEHNEKYNQAMCNIEMCTRCHTYDEDVDIFDLKNSCPRASIYEDRYGLYCGNESDESNNETTYYSYEAVEYFD